MHNGIYDDVIVTERMDRERVEMMVAIYESADGVRDQDIRTGTSAQQLQSTGSDNVKTRSSRAALVCLVLLCFLLLTAVIVLCVFIYTNNTNYTQEREELQTRITNITKEKDELLTNIINLTEERRQLLTNISNLTKERDELLTKIINITLNRGQFPFNNLKLTNENKKKLSKNDDLMNERCQKNNGLQKCQEMDGWICSQSCYFISSEKKNWTESRRDCRERGADLIIINNREEQDFVIKCIKTGINAWIGLTEVDEEGQWKWVDDRSLASEFWCTAPGEPNGGTRENCALTHSTGWADYPCHRAFQWICETSF